MQTSFARGQGCALTTPPGRWPSASPFRQLGKGNAALAAKEKRAYSVAIYHLSVKTISRSAGRSATAAIAYRSGEKVLDERTGIVHDYTRRSGVEHTEIFLPANAPKWASDRQALWNGAEHSENRKNSVVAREFEVALPAELDGPQRLALVRDFARELVERHGMAVDVAIHEPGREGDNRNHHAHILCSTRRLTPEGFKEKTRELDDQKSGEVGKWRERWANLSNHHLEIAGRAERIDHRSLETQRAAAIERGDNEQAAVLDRRPTVHMGPNVVQMEKRGIHTERGEQNREARQYNAQVIDLAEVRKRIEAVNLAEQQKPAELTGRDAVQRDVNADQLRDFVKAREGARLPREAANDSSPEKIKAEWQAEKARQFTLVVNKARKVQTRAADQMERQEGKLTRQDAARPEEPTGLFAGMKKAAHTQALGAWRSVRAGLEKRWSQLQGRVHLVGEYMRKAGAYEMPTKGEKLAETKAAKARPELALNFQQVIEKEKAAAIATQRTKIEQQRQAKQEQRAMKMESIEELKQRTDSNRAQAEKAERNELDKAGHQARLQQPMADQTYDGNQITKTQADSVAKELNAGTDKGDLTKEAKRQELLKRFQEKVQSDRENDRGRGR